MSCEYCGDLIEVESDDKEGLVIYGSNNIKSSVAECNSWIRLLKFEYEDEGEEWAIEFSVDEEWEEKLPITVGNPFSSYRKSEFTHMVKEGFECSEWFDIKFCPFCGRKLGADAE